MNVKPDFADEINRFLQDPKVRELKKYFHDRCKENGAGVFTMDENRLKFIKNPVFELIESEYKEKVLKHIEENYPGLFGAKEKLSDPDSYPHYEAGKLSAYYSRDLAISLQDEMYVIDKNIQA